MKHKATDKNLWKKTPFGIQTEENSSVPVCKWKECRRGFKLKKKNTMQG